MAGIVVTFNPDQVQLQRGLSAIARQVDLIVLVDNASRNWEVCSLEEIRPSLNVGLKIISLPENVGLGAGFNAGIREAQALGCSFVTLFDQDSVPQAGMIDTLAQAYRAISRSGIAVAAVGPRFVDPESGGMSAFTEEKSTRNQNQNDAETEPVATDFLISSGCFIAISTLGELGGMDESLFIDYVDAEWCLRARAKGWRVYGVQTAFMEHTLGEKRQRIWLLRWRSVSYHATFRYYYIFRNSRLLRKRAYIPQSWKRGNRWHNLMLAGYLLLIAPHRMENLKMVWRGIVDGGKGVTGQMRGGGNPDSQFEIEQFIR